jgi:predicted CXXCH cytochrome family protein
VGSISVACLSCHDGTQAMDNIINAPGSGGLLTAGGAANGLGYVWTSPNGSLDTTGFGRLVAGAAAIGTDLRNDHPIGIEYCGGFNGTTCLDPDFRLPSVGTKTTQAGTTLTQYWVNSAAAGATAARQKTDMILYERSFTTGTVTTLSPTVECGSCHDPHVDGTGTSGATFLRISNNGSAVCLTCHVK